MANPALAFDALQKRPRETAAERQARHRQRRNERQAARLGRVKDADNASNHPGLAHAKGASLDQDAADEHRETVRQIAKTRRKVWRRSTRCEFCGDSEQETARKSPVGVHQMHEQPSRAKTRNLPPEERFNTAICCRICDPCHRLATANVIRANFHSDRGFGGDFDVINVADGQILRVMRRSVEDCAVIPSDQEI